jgi:hypothetical protein
MRSVNLHGPAQEGETTGRQLDAGDRIGSAQDDAVEVAIEIHPFGPPCR